MEFGKDRAAQSFELFHRGFQFEFRFLDDRVDDVRLVASFDFAADGIPDAGEVGLAGEMSFDRRAAGRELVDHAGVEVAVERQREGARDRRCGEDEHMRGVAVGDGLVDQALALEDAEAVLLVDGHEAEAMEGDFVFDQGVGADYQIGFAAGDAVEGGGFFGGFHAADQELDFVVAGFQDAFGGEVVLDGEDFGGGHYRGLRLVFDRDYRGLQGYDRFAAAHVALQEAVHRRWLFQVGGDFGEDTFLRVGGLEREDAFQGVANVFFANVKGDCFLFAGGTAFEGKTELEEEELFEDEAALGRAAVFVQRGDGFVRRREVRLRYRDRAWRKLETSAEFFGKDFGHAARVDQLEGGVDGAANGAGAEGADGFVDGDDAANFGGVGGVRTAVSGERFDLGIHHFDAGGAEFVDFGFAVED